MAIVYFLLVLSVLVLLHEAGHYLTARVFGIKSDEFGFGFPPRMVAFVKQNGKWKRLKRTDNGPYPGTIWSINWLPLGGFVRIKGEQGDGEHERDSFHHASAWQRFIIIAAGVFMNWLLAAVLFASVFMIGSRAVLEDLPAGAHIQNRAVRVMEVIAGAPAAEAGIRPGDAVISIAGKEATAQNQARDTIGQQGTSSFTVVIDRNGVRRSVSVTSRYLSDIGRPGIGVALADVGDVSLPPLTAIQAGVVTTAQYTKAVVVGYGTLIRDLVVHREVPTDVSGPVGIAVMTGEIAQQGIMPLLQFAAVLSVNLAVLNFLPIPALDGGRALFIVIEKIRRRAINRKLEAAVHNIAFLLLIGLILLVTVRDLSRYGGMIIGGLKGLVGM